MTICLAFPCTPPWYEKEHPSLEPAHYGMPGSPAGLARVDKLFGVDMYTTSFTTAPMPFGAFPSLHAANATLEALFMSWAFPRLRPLFVFYVGWLWWATMYLNHHYAVDLVGGSLIAAGIYLFARARYLPRPQAGKKNRWAYDFVDIGEVNREEGAYGLLGGKEFVGLESLTPRRRRSYDEEDAWTFGSSSSFFSTASSPRTSTTSGEGSASMGVLSPVTPDGRHEGFSRVEGFGGGAIDWARIEGERAGELSEVVVVRS